jgi:hypothetical protein
VERTQDGTRLLGEEKKGAVRHWAGGGAQTRGEAVVCGAIARGFTINARHDGLWIGVDDLGRSTAGPAAGVGPGASWRAGAWLCPVRLAAWAQHTRESRATEGPTGYGGSTMESSRYRTPETLDGATWTRKPSRARRVTRRARDAGGCTQIPFPVPVFENDKRQKVITNLKISKNKSCGGAIGVYFSQRVTYVLVNRSTGKM